MQQGYTGPEVCNITGISYRQLDHWTSTKLVDASIRKTANRNMIDIDKALLRIF